MLVNINVSGTTAKWQFQIQNIFILLPHALLLYQYVTCMTQLIVVCAD